MEFKIKNIAAIGQADITIDGITIIAGENNTGKSTIGKALYAFLDNMSHWSDTYAYIIQKKTEQFLLQNSTPLEDYCLSVSGAKRRRTSKIKQLIEKYISEQELMVAIEDYQVEEDSTKLTEILYSFGNDYLLVYFKNIDDKTKAKNDKFITNWVKTVLSPLLAVELDELKLQTEQIYKSLEIIFDKQTRKIGTTQSSLTFIHDDRQVDYSINDSGIKMNTPLRFTNNIYFIESPKIYDYLSDTKFGKVQKQFLQSLMTPNVFRHNSTYLTNYTMELLNRYQEDFEINKHYLDIAHSLETTMGGRAEFLQKVGLEFKDNFLPETIHASNVSTGLKSLALLEYGLRIGAIENDDVIILDEPEINLHPEWQIEYAKAIVELEKHCNIKFIITTHSPFFIRAIECFSDLHNQMNNLNVYRIEKDQNNKQTIENVMYSEYGVSDLYEDLSAPLDKLEDLLKDKYGDAY